MQLSTVRLAVTDGTYDYWHVHFGCPPIYRYIAVVLELISGAVNNCGGLFLEYASSTNSMHIYCPNPNLITEANAT